MDSYVKETDFQDVESHWFNVRGEVLLKRFKSRNIPVELLENKEDVHSFIRNFVASHDDIQKIAFSDGVTLYQLDLFDWVRKEFADKEIYSATTENTKGTTIMCLVINQKVS